MINAGQQGAVVAARSAATTGLVSPKNKGRAKESFLIDGNARRLHRMRKVIGHSARLLHFDATGERQRYRKVFVTLTYRDAEQWEPGHVRQFLRRIGDWCRERGVARRYVWCAELQKRGVVHYHVLLWIPRKFLLPKPDKRGWWPHGATNIKEAQHAVSYIAKYASKTTWDEAARFPKGARLFGHGGVETSLRPQIRYWLAPRWVKDTFTGNSDIRKCKGGYVNKYTGEFVASPWQISLSPDGRHTCWKYLPEGVCESKC